MKKQLLTLAAVLISGFAFAQRTIDWSVDLIESPDSLRSTSTNTPIPVDVVLKNLGTDSVVSGDSIWYQLLLTTPTNQIITGFPSSNPSQFLVRTANKTIKTGDTMHITLGLVFNAVINQTSNIKFVFTSLVRNSGSITPEATGTLANNSKEKPIIWYNVHGWSVGTGNGPDGNDTKVYPNPVKDVLHVETSFANEKVLSIMDITGKQVEEIRFFEDQAEVNVAAYNRGIYVFQLRTAEGQLIKSGKIAVN